MELANALDAAMNVAVPYMNSNPMRPHVGEILRGAAKSALHPRRFGPLTQFMTASQAEFIDSRFEDHRVKSLLAAVPCFAPISDDGTAWVLIYFGMIHRDGVGRFEGGTGAVTDALARCFAAAGGHVMLDSPVAKIIMAGDRAAGVRLESGRELRARAVITTNNVKTVLTEWLPDGILSNRLARRARHIPTAGTHASSFKVDVALSGRATLPAHQANRRDGIDLRQPALCFTTFDDHVAAWADCARGQVPDPLPGFAILPTGMDPTQAPDGQDTFWFWSGISPVQPSTPWSQLAAPTADKVLTQAGKYIDGLDELAIARRVMSPSRHRRAVPRPRRQRLPRRPDRHPLRPVAPRGRIRGLPITGRRAVPQRSQYPSQRRHLRCPRAASSTIGAALPAGRKGARMSTALVGSRSSTPEPSRRYHVPGETGIWVFIFGDMMVFAIMFATYLYYRGKDVALFNASQERLEPRLRIGQYPSAAGQFLLVVLAVRAVRRALAGPGATADPRRDRLCGVASRY